MSGCNGAGKSEAGFEEIEIPVPWGHISGKWWGPKDKQPIIGIHGWQDNAGSFDRLAPLLTDSGFSIFCIDLPGHGFSSHFPPGQYYYLFWDGLHVIRLIIKHFKWEKVTIIGHSLGGAIAFFYAATYPNDVEKYVSIDIAAPTARDKSKMVAQVGEGIDKFIKFEYMKNDKIPCYKYEEMIDVVEEAYRNNLDREACKVLMKRGMKEVNNPKDHYVFSRDVRLKVISLGLLSLDEILEFASKTTCEVLNIRACPGHAWLHPEHYDLVLDTIKKTAKNVEKHKIPGSHHVHLMNAHAVAKILVQFLK